MTQATQEKEKKEKTYKRVKTPTVLQMEGVECGAASLSIILSYYGRIVPLPELRITCGVSRDGSNAANVVKAARTYGMQAKGFKKDPMKLKDVKPPFIVFWNFNHFLVVEGFVKDEVYLNDPMDGPRKISFEEFDRAYTGIVLIMEPGPDFKKGGRKPSMVAALYNRLNGSLGAILYCILAGLLLVIPGLAVAVFSQVFVDNILVENRMEWLRPLILGMILTAIVQGMLSLLQFRYLRHLQIKLSVTMSGNFLWHVLRLPQRFYAQRFAGEIGDRVNLNTKVANILSGELAKTVIDAMVVVFYAVVMLAYDWVLTLIGIFFSAVNVIVLQWVARRRKDTHSRLTQDEGKLAGVSIAALQSIETLKSAALESDFFARWSGYYAKTTNAQQTLGVPDQILGILPSLVTSLTTLFLLVVGGFRVMRGELSIGMLVAFQSLMTSFQQPVSTLVQFGSTLQELEGDINRLDDVLDNEVDAQVAQENKNQKALQVYAHTSYKLQGYLELQNLTFGYAKVNPPLVEDLSLKLQPGQRVALVGGSGSGKSTVAKLVAGLYEPWSGEILLDSIPRGDIPREVLTNSLSMVEQDIFLFGGTVRDNLTLWDSTIPNSQLIRACEDAKILDAVLAIPGGLDGSLLEGAGNLSGGQRQRLEIARALVNDPSLLVMDEATSALDAETEKIIDQNLRRRGCTCLIVAHRLSTIRDCDEIIVLEQGKVVQRGTHEEMKQDEDSVYARLIQSE
ncbi:NHLP family bacteriocin export ABC transporter peptidase/permease/ATPase subunit [Roseofilum sp. BLCC_M91]|uniref:NHLP family bacteriocin export ABC transporter peptidase/permease/ATPase subunit n=1 Tax=Roseofilum halophilum BLCC-M91 TaxID=3022259 RepID=A0ABT7BJA6_9CYAN|nr:NHLP family bacteriocin export ABC transporter peptidase/permease/ATPase subunit [Roseofilum halophilum]MDJ1179265.1 NHLP family bacteriocin export ABC transporter peptidase/permease/ATPase subunit [Roseofilum halophilum BLCC-M91]